jgi:DNA-binding NarL/FixJ family response regulator
LDHVTVRCLLVDDSEEFLASASRLLDSQGVEIVGRASTGHQALRLAAALEPEVALVDIELAGEDGIALTEKLDARAPSTCVVLISTYERDDLADLILDSPAVGFLPKSAPGAAAIAGLLHSRA